MLRHLPDGLYEHVVTGILDGELAGLGPSRSAKVEALDPANAHVALSRYLATEVERALASLPHTERLDAQVGLRLLSSREPLALRALRAREDEFRTSLEGAA